MVQYGQDPGGSWWVSIPGEKNLGPLSPAEAIKTAKQLAAVRGVGISRVTFGSIAATAEPATVTTEDPKAEPEPAKAPKKRAPKAAPVETEPAAAPAPSEDPAA